MLIEQDDRHEARNAGNTPRAALLASDDADCVTGATYFVDGGLTYSYHEQ